MAEPSEIAGSNRMVVRGLDRLLTVQRPVVLAHIRAIRRGHANASPAEIIAILERRFLMAVTTGGAAVGATAAVPAIGTGASLALSGVETAGFLEASALFAQSVTEVHGIMVEDPDRARALVMAMVLGKSGSDLVKQLAGQATGGAPSRNVFWGEMVTKSMPRGIMGPIADQIQKTFLKKFTVAQGTNIAGRLIPFGIGAVIGGGGNHLLGRQIVKSSREGFGPPPAQFPGWLEPVIRMPKPPKAVKPPKAPKELKPPKAPKAVKPPKAVKGPKELRAPRPPKELKPPKASKAIAGPPPRELESSPPVPGQPST